MNLKQRPWLLKFLAFVCVLALATTAIGQCVIPGATTVTVTTSWSPLAADTGKIYWANCSSVCTVTVPTTPPTAVWRVKVQVVGAGAVTVAAGGTTVNDPTSAASYPTGSVFEISTDGATNYYVTRLVAPLFIRRGTFVLNTAVLASGACETIVTVSATGVLTTDVISVGFNTDPTAITGYGASATGAVLSIYPYPTADNVNVKVCNSTPNSITPSALTLNWEVVR
jgi:hypothetical protein